MLNKNHQSLVETLYRLFYKKPKNLEELENEIRNLGEYINKIES